MTLRPLLAYLPWHARDAIVRSLVAVLLFSLFAVTTLSVAGKQSSGTDFSADAAMRQFAEGFYANISALTLLLGALLVMNQVVAKDRERQYFRFLFAHQVAPWAFYLQRFVVGVALYAASFLVVPVVYSQLITPVPILGTLWSALLLGAFFGAFAMLVGAITQKDGLVVIVVYVLARLLQDPATKDVLPTWAQWLGAALPGIHAVNEVSEALVEGSTLVAAELWLALFWTAGMLIGSLVIIRRTALAR